ncbi:hypothetical protein ALI144C_22500 [Actinosynnema sp. ALI-1.44]|uniref:radical SAM/SPASM domain-containing protein n=1 Tax=Actinosynnema sp. ALI-1.44 TaxID=1933779 RepID=UPI00097BAA53|nr:radical SAM protein [Actinosynnema sp. ALI-1.44]ONI81294.1 hypothetical protein ALI144C_22500 [Actinosynnema sp. ALI-1.44]
MWKLSQFTVVRNLGDRDLPSHNLIFNTETSKCMTVRDADWRRIMAGMVSSDSAGDVRAAIDRLAKDRIIVPTEEDQAARFQATFDRQRRNPGRILPLLAVTSGCNIACTYCYESGVRGKTMTPDVVDGCLRWMERRITRDGIREIYPGLFGGEPLMVPKILFAIMDGFARLTERHGARGEFYCSSNGLLLTDDLARELAARKLTQIQISLDGPAEIHDKRRVGHRGQPSFDESLSAIKIAVRHIRNVTVKVNFDRQNREFIADLFDTLHHEGLADRVNVKLEAIAYQFPDSKVAHDKGLPIPPESVELADAYVQLMLQARERDIAVSSDTAHTTPCMFSSEHGVLIGPEGEIYKCISFVGRKDYAVGTVFEEEYDTAAYDEQMNAAKRLTDCYEEECAYIPVCAGGCAYESAVRTGRHDLRFCTKQYLAEFHFKRHLVRFRTELEALGMRPLTSEELAASASPPKPTRGSTTFISLGQVGLRSARSR